MHTQTCFLVPLQSSWIYVTYAFDRVICLYYIFESFIVNQCHPKVHAINNTDVVDGSVLNVTGNNMVQCISLSPSHLQLSTHYSIIVQISRMQISWVLNCCCGSLIQNCCFYRNNGASKNWNKSFSTINTLYSKVRKLISDRNITNLA